MLFCLLSECLENRWLVYFMQSCYPACFAASSLQYAYVFSSIISSFWRLSVDYVAKLLFNYILQLCFCCKITCLLKLMCCMHIIFISGCCACFSVLANVAIKLISARVLV